MSCDYIYLLLLYFRYHRWQREHRFFSRSEFCKTAGLELWSVDDCLTPGKLFLAWFGGGGRGGGAGQGGVCTYLAGSLFFPLCVIVGYFDQIIRLNMIKLQGSDQSGSPEKNVFSPQVSFVLQDQF